jgi:heme/copper-type cytochrome/quinol oxidase subunit 2
LLLVGTGIYLAAGPFVRHVLAAPAGQEQAPTRREFTVTARDYSFSPNRVEVQQDDLIKLTVQSADNAYGFTIDDYRVSKRVPAGGSTVIEFRADRAGTFAFYSNLSNDSRHSKMSGQLIVRPR